MDVSRFNILNVELNLGKSTGWKDTLLEMCFDGVTVDTLVSGSQLTGAQVT